MLVALRERILDQLVRKEEEDWTESFAKPRCDHVSLLAVVLGDILAKAGCEKFVLVLDGVDRQREAGQTLLPALARLGEIVCSFRHLWL